MLLAHRASWAFHFGYPPDDQFVCHRCDNPACVRPDHLFLGSNADNMRDMVAKGRHSSVTKPELVLRGESNGNAVLTEHDVRQIRAMGESGAKRLGLAKHFGISLAQVKNILRRKQWAHVA
jgi:hypothetical protein